MKIDRRFILVILFSFVSFLCPMAMSPVSDEVVIGYVFLTPVLAYDYGVTEGITIISGMYYWSIYLPLVAPLSLLFVVQVIRSINGKAHRNHVFYVGILSLIFPGLFLTWAYIPSFLIGQYGYAGPVPIQYIFGMKLVSKYGHYSEELEWIEVE